MWQCVCTWSTSSFYQLNSTWPTYATWAVWCNAFLTYICKFVGKKKSQFWMFSPLYLEKSVITASSVQANSLMQPLNVDVKWPDVSSCTDFCPGNPPAKHQQCYNIMLIYTRSLIRYHLMPCSVIVSISRSLNHRIFLKFARTSRWSFVSKFYRLRLVLWHDIFSLLSKKSPACLCVYVSVGPPLITFKNRFVDFREI
jgi:hypothetical protein